MTLDALAGRGAFRCGCGIRIKVTERQDPGRCVGTGCRLAATRSDPLPLCREHYMLVLSSFAADAMTAPEQPDSPEPDLEFARRRAYMRLAAAVQSGRGNADDIICPSGSVVYFIKNGGLIKIGTSVSLEERVRHMALNKAAILATEPGGRDREQELHRRFARYRDHGEWFRPGRELLAYIGSVRQAGAVAPHGGTEGVYARSRATRLA